MVCLALHFYTLCVSLYHVSGLAVKLMINNKHLMIIVILRIANTVWSHQYMLGKFTFFFFFFLWVIFRGVFIWFIWSKMLCPQCCVNVSLWYGTSIIKKKKRLVSKFSKLHNLYSPILIWSTLLMIIYSKNILFLRPTEPHSQQQPTNNLRGVQ